MNNIKEAIRRINSGLSLNENKTSVITFVTFNNTRSQKSIIANMALMYGHSKEKTLIIDTDFTMDTFPEVFHVNPEKGLSDFLNDRSVSIKDIVTVIPKQDVSIITSGAISKDESGYLVGDSRFQELLLFLNKEYDRILINTSTMQNYDEIKKLLIESDGVVFVIDTLNTKKKVVFKFIDAIWRDKVNLLGYINAVR